MSLAEFLGRLTGALDAADVPYMVCGSVASFFHGVPRTTQDLDLVVELRVSDLPRLLEHFPDTDFYVSEHAARDAARFRRQFNIIDLNTAWKADLIVKKPRAFSKMEFERRIRVQMMGSDVWVASAEDTILAKLEWSKDSRSDRQLNDARGIVSVQGDRLDQDYLTAWAAELGVTERLADLLKSDA